MVANKYYDMALLQNDAMFQQVVEQVVIAQARVIESEAGTVANHVARLAMAKDVLEANSQLRGAFVARAVIEAVSSDAIRDAAVVGGPVNAAAIPEATLEAGIAQIWNKVMFAIWPDVPTT